jgi:hypothetical protein
MCARAAGAACCEEGAVHPADGRGQHAWWPEWHVRDAAIGLCLDTAIRTAAAKYCLSVVQPPWAGSDVIAL